MQKKFSYPLKIDELTQNEYVYKIEATADELVDICSILQVENVNSFSAQLHLKLNLREHLLRVWGNVKASLVLQSVVTLNNFEQKYDVPFELFFDTKATYRDIREIDNGINDDIPDIIENGTINLADIAIEQIALQIDDYPRAEGEIFEFKCQDDEGEATEKENPFAVLQKLVK